MPVLSLQREQGRDFCVLGTILHVIDADRLSESCSREEGAIRLLKLDGGPSAIMARFPGDEPTRLRFPQGVDNAILLAPVAFRRPIPSVDKPSYCCSCFLRGPARLSRCLCIRFVAVSCGLSTGERGCPSIQGRSTMSGMF